MSKLLENLNAEQKQAIEHTKGPLLIIAGAGTGKTAVITKKIAYLIERGLANPDEILALTFTDKAAQEMEERVDKLLPYGYVDLWIQTFHSFCDEILKTDGIEIGLPEYKLLSEPEQWMLIRKNLDKFNLNYYKPLGNPTKFIKHILKHFSRAKDELISPEEYMEYAQNKKLEGDSAELIADERARLNEIANGYNTYNQLLLEVRALDFGGLLNYCLYLLQKRPRILKKYRNKFKYIFVDEFQDTNLAQYELVKLLATPNNNLTVVGDDDQSIYRFRGASMSNILTFAKDYPDCAKIALTKNYRSGQKILDTAYNFISLNNPNRLEISLGEISKKLTSQIKEAGEVSLIEKQALEEEVGAVAGKIIELKENDKSATWDDFAILVRSNESAKPFIHQLEILGLPHQFLASRGLYAKPIIASLIAFIKLMDNYRESSAMYKLLSMPVWGINAREIADISYHARKKALSLYEACKEINTISKNKELCNKINKVVLLLEKLREDASTKKGSQIMYDFLRDSGLLVYIKNLDDEKEQIQNFAYINKFYKKQKEFEKNSESSALKDFMETLDLELEAGELGSIPFDPNEGPETIKIMTIHSSKGLEFKYVFVCSMVDKRFPSTERKEQIELPNELLKETLPQGDTHLEEERRLFYVAATRAKKKLFLSWARDYGGAREKKPSRFLQELGLVEPHEKIATIKKNVIDETHTIKDVSSKEKIKHIPKHFSYSQITAYRKCPYQYKLRFVLNIPTEGGYRASFGRSLHNTLEKFFNLIKQASDKEQVGFFGENKIASIPPFVKLQKIYEENWINEWYETREQMLEHKKKGLGALRKYYKKLQETPATPLFLEQEFTLKIGGESIKGVIDRIDKLDGNSVLVMDYKSSETVPEKLSFDNKEQLLIYYLAIKDILELEPKTLMLNYISEGEERQFEATEKDLLKVKDRFLETVTQIKSDNFKATPEENTCKFCDYKNICEFRK